VEVTLSISKLLLTIIVKIKILLIKLKGRMILHIISDLDPKHDCGPAKSLKSSLHHLFTFLGE